MHTKYHILGAVLLLTFAACEDDTPVIIDTLSKGGDTFHFGEKVIVWAGVSGDIGNITYDWSCTGGEFDGHATQHLFENLWVAPNEPGNYTVMVTAKTGKESDSRETNMKVTNYFFDSFESGSMNLSGWTGSNATRTFTTTEGINGNTVTCLRVESTATSDAYTRKTTTDLPLKPPFSVQTVFKYSRYRTATSVTTAGHGLFLSLYFEQPKEQFDKPFIREIRWEICPSATGTNANWRLRMESYVLASNQSRWASNTGTNLPIPKPFIPNQISGRNNLFAFGANTYKTLTMTIDVDLNFTACVDGQVWVDKSPAIRNFLEDNGVLDHRELIVRELRLTQPRKSGSNAANGETTLFLTDVRINDAKTAIGGDVNHIGFEELK
ncbi:MAG: hypothetical protein AB2L24_15555 [Mangrovibacterium sp.]